MEPSVTDAQVKQARYEINALIIAGLVKHCRGQVDVLRFPDNDASLPQRLAVLQLLDPTVNLQEVSEAVPRDANAAPAAWPASAAEALAKLLHLAATQEVPATSVQSCPDMFGEVSSESQQASALEGSEAVESAREPPSKRKRSSESDDLNEASIKRWVGPIAQIIKACLLSVRTEIPSHEIGKKFAGTIEEEHRQKATTMAFQTFFSLGLGLPSSRRGKLILARPPQGSELSEVSQRLAEVFRLDEPKLQARLRARTANEGYCREGFQTCMRMLAPIMNAHEASLEEPSPAAPAAVAAGAAAVAGAAVAPEEHPAAGDVVDELRVPEAQLGADA